MSQILHIFNKDARRHWIEVLVSLALLALYTRHELHPWANQADDFSIGRFLLQSRFITPVLVIYWCYLIVRVVQGESLVGERQWWITKPYEWWNLLAAKLLFILIFIWVPFFHAQLFLLHRANFPILRNLWGVVLMQFSLSFILFLACILLGSLTKNLAQALLGIAAVTLFMIGVALLINEMPNSGMQRFAETSQSLQSIFVLCALLAAPLWQFARRRTWPARGLFFALSGIVCLLGIFTPYGKYVPKVFPLVDPRDSPVQVTPMPLAEMNGTRKPLVDALPNVYLSLPLKVSGVASGSVILLQGIKITADSRDDSRWSKGWKSEGSEIWPEDKRIDVSYEIDRKEYVRVKTKPLLLHVEMALAEFKETEARDFFLPTATFDDETLGTCRVNPTYPAQFQCLKPITQPGYMMRFDPRNSPCAAIPNDDDDPQEYPAFHAWQLPHYDYLPDASLNPVLDYPVWFKSTNSFTSLSSSFVQSRNVARLCSGTELRIAKPEFKRQIRVKFDLPSVRLLDLGEFDWQ